ncbi:hypothetical protein WN51_06860 [Melipona quadrifasciata]|uniref:Uncharacterized protein n=1 Tax=Melipona quadrifasciata TaxID=166423 RepID=A0A0M8ZQB0_9HYME|nr:hypothetical protein WN51_06860 [Melipona quadrifasciata]
MLKSHYYNLMQNMKAIKDKYIKLKMENIEQKKKLMSFEIQNSRLKTLNSFSDISTPKSNNQRSLRTRPTSNSYVSSCGTNLSNKSFDTTKGKAMLESFRIPFDPRTIRSVDSRGTLNANSTYL